MQGSAGIELFGAELFPGLAEAAEKAVKALHSLNLFSSDDAEYFLFPGFCDVHVHFREPGFSYKETIRTGSRAAARGGCTAVCAMPNLNPVPDCMETLRPQLDIIERNAAIRVLPYGAITRGASPSRSAASCPFSPTVSAA